MAKTTQDPDFHLARAWAAGDKNAGGKLIEKYGDRLYSFFNQNVAGDVGDILQETFEACTKSIATFESRSTFKTWLWGIARNKLLEYYKKNRHGSEIIVNLSKASLADLGATPPQVIDDNQDGRLILEAMRNVPLDQQILLQLFYWEGLKGHELGEVLRVPENTARSRLRRARELFAREIERLENDPVKLKTTLSTLDGLMASLREKTIKWGLRSTPGSPSVDK